MISNICLIWNVQKMFFLHILCVFNDCENFIFIYIHVLTDIIDKINKYELAHLLKLQKANFKRAIHKLGWHFILSNWLNWEEGNTNDDWKRMFIALPDQNTNSLTKLPKYPGVTHLPTLF